MDRDEIRSRKMARLKPLLRREMSHVWRGEKVDFLTEELCAETGIVDTDNVSSMGYDADMIALIEKHADGLVLDCGAGSKSDYYPNVVCYEIVDYPSTDVLGVAEHLPFVDDAFDAVLSVAVLEHVRDPFRAADELVRVLKPGGDLLCAVPFLQPLHGYPHHYFNATPQGIRRLFENGMEDIEVNVPLSTHPIHALNWILASWASGLSEPTREAFLTMRVSDLIKSPWSHLASPFATELSAAKLMELACGTVLTARKSSSQARLGWTWHHSRLRDFIGRSGR